MTDDRKADILRKVRAMLDKADATPYAAEADTFRAKADQMMVAYAIEAWQVDNARAAHGQRPQPEIRNFGLEWYYQMHTTADEMDVAIGLYSMFQAMVSHCRCMCGPQGWDSGHHSSWLPVVGMPADLDYLDLMFTAARLEYSKRLVPSWDTALPDQVNIFVLKEAGFKWDQIASKAEAAWWPMPEYPGTGHGEALQGLLEAYGQARDARQSGMREHPGFKVTGSGGFNATVKLSGWWISQYKKECKERGVQPHGVNPAVYRRSFAIGFRMEVRRRLAVMSAATTDATTTGNSDSTALVLRDIAQVIRDALYAAFPQLKPHAKDCTCEACTALRDARNKPVKVTKGRAYTLAALDGSAMDRGKAAGARVDLTAPGSKPKGRHTLPS